MLSRQSIPPKSLVFFILSVFLIGFLIISTLNSKQCMRIDCLEMNGLEEFKLAEIYQEEDDVFRGLYSKGDKNEEFIRVNTNLFESEEDAEKLINAQVIRMKDLFENSAAPYPGEISDEIACGDEFTPNFVKKIINGIEVSYFSGFLNDRLVFGACTEDQVAYEGILTLFYCSNHKKAYQLEFITKMDSKSESKSFEDLIQTIQCKEVETKNIQFQ